MKRTVVAILFVFLMASCLIEVKPVSATSPTENSWTTKTPMPQAIPGCKAAVVDGKIYVMGGSANYEYNPVADNWTARKPMPTPRLFFGIAVYQNKIYTIGGRNDVSYSVNEVYDPSTDTWETKQPMPAGASDLDANVVDGRIYLICKNQNEVYDISNDSWTTSTPMPYPVCAYASAVLNNKIYVFGGLGSVFCSQTQIFDPENNSWTLGTPMPTPVPNAAAGATTGVMAPKRIYVFGGDSGFEHLEGSNFNQVYNPESNTWISGALMPTARSALTVAVVNDTLYAIGGAPIFISTTTANEQYYPFGYGTIPAVVSIISPKNTTYTETVVPLSFTVDRPTSWIGYSLDGQDNITIGGNTTLPSLPNGAHNITLYAANTGGFFGASETIYFSVAKPEPFPTLPVAASIASVMLVGVGALIYFRKRKLP